ncbi:carotenoid-cleaving dioxygenase, mitochondrial-like [Rhipicephalus sanguineus]|uniref:carotenoid-cleaving dioxygenase, mitochondrial-like n=1 Tax=Rhipicephalus sanguineus TaxID=34632 RepID=UPI0018930403|nr:carotenoid-cleaving dioxygenase, mitochondrial-like [Rhipicephalus sanguineus]
MERLIENRQEVVEQISTRVIGTMPEWVSGKLFRLGPGMWELDGGFSLQHWFDGAAILSSYEIHKGKVYYSSRYLESEAYKKMSTVNRPVVTEFGTKCYPDPCKNIFSRFFAAMVPSDLTDNNFGNVYTLGDELFCTSETCFVWKVDQDSLEVIQRYDVNKLVSVNLASAHPITLEDGTSYNLGASFISGLKYHIVKIPPPSQGCAGLKRASVAYHIPSSWKTTFSYYHSFGMTRNYVVFVEQPLLVNTIRLIGSRIKGYSFKDCFDWTPKEKTRFVVIDRNTGTVLRTRFLADPLFFFHAVNAFEDDGHIVFDMVAYDDASIMDRYYLDRFRNGMNEDFDPDCQGHFRRFVIPVSKAGSAMEGDLVSLSYSEAHAYRRDDSTIWLTHEEMGYKGYDLPTINPKYQGKPYRYTYGSGNFERLGECRNAICKLDIQSREMHLWRESDTQFPSEAIFMANPDGIDEDDGVLLSVINDVDYDKPDFLLVLDARTMTEIARAQVPHPVRACTSIHGCFIKS